MSERPRRGLRAAISLTATGLACLAPVVFSVGPFTIGLFMAGAALITAGVLVSIALLCRSLRACGRE